MAKHIRNSQQRATCMNIRNFQRCCLVLFCFFCSTEELLCLMSCLPSGCLPCLAHLSNPRANLRWLNTSLLGLLLYRDRQSGIEVNEAAEHSLPGEVLHQDFPKVPYFQILAPATVRAEEGKQNAICIPLAACLRDCRGPRYKDQRQFLHQHPYEDRDNSAGHNAHVASYQTSSTAS